MRGGANEIKEESKRRDHLRKLIKYSFEGANLEKDEIADLKSLIKNKHNAVSVSDDIKCLEVIDFIKVYKKIFLTCKYFLERFFDICEKKFYHCNNIIPLNTSWLKNDIENYNNNCNINCKIKEEEKDYIMERKDTFKLIYDAMITDTNSGKKNINIYDLFFQNLSRINLVFIQVKKEWKEKISFMVKFKLFIELKKECKKLCDMVLLCNYLLNKDKSNTFLNEARELIFENVDPSIEEEEEEEEEFKFPSSYYDILNIENFTETSFCKRYLNELFNEENDFITEMGKKFYNLIGQSEFIMKKYNIFFKECETNKQANEVLDYRPPVPAFNVKPKS